MGVLLSRTHLTQFAVYVRLWYIGDIMATIHTILGDKVRLYRRPNSSKWQCSASLNGTEHRASTRAESLSRAKDVAEDWYFNLCNMSRQGELQSGKRFSIVAEQFWKEYPIITEGERSPIYVAMHRERLDRYLIPYFGKKGVKSITAGTIQEYRIWRRDNGKSGKPPSRSTLHQEIVTLRQVLKTALRHNWLDSLPDMSTPYKTTGKLEHRPWFSPEEYKKLYTTTRKRCQNIRSKHHRWANEQLHDLILFLANTGMRPDEARNLEFRDIDIVEDADTNETILIIEVRGKRGVGYCKSMPGAVIPFQRLIKRNNPKSTDPVFPKMQNRLFSRVIEQEGLLLNRDGKRRTLYSLRHTYISMRLMEGADIYQIAKNCRTSVEIIEKHYAAHIQNRINAASINMRRPESGKSKIITPTYSDN